MPLASYLDFPKPGDSVCDQSISISGWFHSGSLNAERCRIRAWIGDELIGQTELLYARPDVCAALNLPAGVATGFRMLARTTTAVERASAAEIRITARVGESEDELEIARCAIQLLPARLGQRPYGDVVHPGQERVLRRENIYGSGPPNDELSTERLWLIEQYLKPRCSILDVGCGTGAYGRELISRGYEWLGLEANPVCCEILAARNLPFRETKKTAAVLPVGDAEFDSAICFEVLEHIDEPDAFIGEIARAIRGRALFSVPNLELIPYLSAWRVVPWHLLEADHKNFFTRASLRTLLQKHFGRVEVFSYAELPLRTPDGLPLDIHLFAVADK